MPVSILSALWLWSALLPSGATFAPDPDLSTRLASCPSMNRTAAAEVTIQAWPLAESPDWGHSEATSEEEESSDSDDDVIVAASCWTLPRSGLIDQFACYRLDRGLFRQPNRSTILRC